MTEFRPLWDSLLPIGRDPDSGGYLRSSWSTVDFECREWFTTQATARGLAVETDGNGNLWAWWGDPARGDAVVTGSHFDSVPHGGPYDGPLGIVSAFLAVDAMRAAFLAADTSQAMDTSRAPDTSRAAGAEPVRPVGIVAFVEEEGSRFGVACLGSRLLTGAIDAGQALALRDRDGVTLAEAMRSAGADPTRVGPDPERLGGIGAFVELHVEQGRALAGLGAPVGVASAIWPHGRWRLDVAGEGNHAGTTRMTDRRDPMLTLAFAVLAANKEARLRGAHATVGRVNVVPNATNAVPSRVRGWLDARAADQDTLTGLVEAVSLRVAERANRDGTQVLVTAESSTGTVEFDVALRDKAAAVLGGAPILPTGAGHDAGILSAYVPTAMLFVRNPTGVSHAPGEHATDADCVAGVTALARLLTDLARR